MAPIVDADRPAVGRRVGRRVRGAPGATRRGAARPALPAGLAAVALLSLAACTGAPAPTPTGSPSGGTPTATTPTAPSLPPGEEELTMGTREGQHGALPPWWTGTSVQAEIPAGVAPHDKYRSEFYWNQPDGPKVRVGEGDRIRCRLQIGPHLGATGAERGVWQVVWQLHGPTKAGTWPPPPLNLHVRGGSWRLGGGAGRADGYAAYAKPFPEFVDAKNVTWDLDVVVSSDPAKARVDAWLDGRQVVTDWHPPSGTRYPDHAWLTMKSGLYTGSDPGTKPPTQRRYVTFSPMDCAIDRAAPPPPDATEPATSPTRPPTGTPAPAPPTAAAAGELGDR